jgi:membrane protease subunit (stomatin/prohibitin family)
VRLRTFGNYSFRVADAKRFHTEISGTRDRYTTEDLDGQLRGLMLQHISDAVAKSGVPFLDLAGNLIEFAKQLQAATAPAFEAIGLKLDGVTVQSVSLPEELQKVLDQKIGMGIVGQNMGQFMQYQTAQAIPELAKGVGQGGSGLAGEAMGLGAGVALGQVLAQQLGQGLGAPAAAAAAPAAPAAPSADAVMAMLEKLGELKNKGILTEEEFAAKKADLLAKL